MIDYSKRVEEIVKEIPIDESYYDVEFSDSDLSSINIPKGVANEIKSLILEILSELEMKRTNVTSSGHYDYPEEAYEKIKTSNRGLGYNQAVDELHTKLEAIRENLK